MCLGKLWNDKRKSDGERVLCLHGFQDNCASFDRLIPLLDGDNAYMCLDWPNHGLSSGTPLGVRWTMEHYAMAVKRVLDRVQWPACVCVAHSMGGQVGMLFAAIYPEHVKKLVLLDVAGPVETYPEEIVWRTRRSLDELLRLENRVSLGTNRSPEYDRPEDALHRIRQRVYGAMVGESGETLTRESGMTLMARYLRPGPGGSKHVLANDARLKVTYSELFSVGQHRDVVKRVRCPTLSIRATDSDAFYRELYEVVVGLYSSNPNFRFVRVEGNHDVHLNHPHRVASLINLFLNNNNSCKL